MKRLLVVVDFQKDFVDGALGFPGAEKLDAVISAKIEEYREAGDEIIFTFDTHQENYLDTLEGQHLPIEHCLEGTSGWELFGTVASLIQADDQVFTKPSFGSMELADYLRTKQDEALRQGTPAFSSIELVGLVSNICVIGNAVIAKASCPEVPIIVDAAGTGSYDRELGQKSLDVMEGLQIEVINR